MAPGPSSATDSSLPAPHASTPARPKKGRSLGTRVKPVVDGEGTSESACRHP